MPAVPTVLRGRTVLQYLLIRCYLVKAVLLIPTLQMTEAIPLSTASVIVGILERKRIYALRARPGHTNLIQALHCALHALKTSSPRRWVKRQRKTAQSVLQIHSLHPAVPTLPPASARWGSLDQMVAFAILARWAPLRL